MVAVINLKTKLICDELITFSDVVDSKTFDITLMITLLRNLTNMNPPHSGFDILPTPNETTLGADLARIKYYRNYLAHLDEGKLESTEFNSSWEIISEVCIVRKTYLPLL